MNKFFPCTLKEIDFFFFFKQLTPWRCKRKKSSLIWHSLKYMELHVGSSRMMFVLREFCLISLGSDVTWERERERERDDEDDWEQKLKLRVREKIARRDHRKIRVNRKLAESTCLGIYVTSRWTWKTTTTSVRTLETSAPQDQLPGVTIHIGMNNLRESQLRIHTRLCT